MEIIFHQLSRLVEESLQQSMGPHGKACYWGEALFVFCLITASTKTVSSFSEVESVMFQIHKWSQSL